MTTEKLYLRLRGHYALAAPKAGSKFDGKDVVANDVKINELCELMLVEKTLEKIDACLHAYVQANKGYLFDEGKSLFCVKRLLWNQVDAMIADINKEEEESSARQALVRFGKAVERQNQRKFQRSSGRGNNYNSNNNQSSAKVEMMMCGNCFRAQKPQSVYSTHNIENCNFFSRNQKMRLLGSMARAINVEDAPEATDEDEALEDITTDEASSDL
jgi:hypothetical protein